MGYLRFLFRYTLLAVLLKTAGPVVFAQPAMTRILDTLYNADGTKFVGELLIQPVCTGGLNNLTITPKAIKYCIVPTGGAASDCDGISRVAGEIDLNLVPTGAGSTITPAGRCRYTTRYVSDRGGSFTESWNPPVSGAPLRVRSFATTTGLPPAGGNVPVGNINAAALADGCVRVVSGQFQSFSGPNCAVPQTPPFEQTCTYTFTAQSSITVPGTHCGWQTQDVVFQCFKNDGSYMLCGSGGIDPVSFELKLAWASAQTGYVLISGRSGQVPNQGFTFTNQSTVTITQAQHGATHNRIMAACYEATTDPTTGTYNWFFCSPVVNQTTHDVTFNFAAPKSGRIVLTIK